MPASAGPQQGATRERIRTDASDPPQTPRAQGPLCLRGRVFQPGQPVIMGIVNRTPDSFFQPGDTWEDAAAMERVRAGVDEGADIIDIGGVPAKPGDTEIAEEIRRVVPMVAAVRAAFPDLVISVDTWRHQVARAVCEAGADLINDTWGGWDAKIADVAAEFNAGIVCSHAGSQTPRTRPFRVWYPDVMADVLTRTLRLADHAVAAGVDRSKVLIDPAHDFGKNSWQSLEVTRRLAEMAETGWPVLVSVSRKDFIGETLGLAVTERLTGTLATASVCAWLGARVFRVHDVAQARQAVDMVAAIRGDLVPERMVRGLT